jgi:hypothetical protein
MLKPAPDADRRSGTLGLGTASAKRSQRINPLSFKRLQMLEE